jgi:hypothetical protein
MWHIGLVLVAIMAGTLLSTGLAVPASGRSAGRYARAPVLTEAAGGRFRFEGFIGERLKANQEEWLLSAPFANPAMLEMFRDRDRQPYRDLLPWSGEFVGKYLTAAALNWRVLRAPSLKRVIDRVASDFVATQSPEGYLGPFPKERRLLTMWDLWGHYHALVGLLLWYDSTSDERALAAARRAGDFVCATFSEGGRRVASVADQEMNEAIIHGMLLLYERTGEERYLDMARRVEQDWETPPSGDYVRTALAGVPFHATPKPRWESLHDVEAIAHLHWITGDEKYRQAFEHIWWTIVEGDRHNTGGFSSGEKACGNPYDPSAIETCCTVAWIALSLDMLKLSGLSVVADEVELATFNGGVGGQTPSGRWWTYNTPMDGEKKASFHDIGFQCRPGSPELNCCSVNGPRILGMIGQWSLMAAGDGLAVNYYGPCQLSARLPSGRRIVLREETAYPRQGKVVITVGLAAPQRFVLRLRIPYWSAHTIVKVNGKGVPAVSGSYLALDRTWKDGDKIELALDMSLHFWAGERECAGKTAIYRGPILLAYDPRFNPTAPDPLLPLSASGLRPEIVRWSQCPEPWLLVKVKAANGRAVLLCDFATAGATGTRYATWLRVEGAKPVPFSRENPLRSGRLSQAR